MHALALEDARRGLVDAPLAGGGLLGPGEMQHVAALPSRGQLVPGLAQVLLGLQPLDQFLRVIQIILGEYDLQASLFVLGGLADVVGKNPSPLLQLH